MKLMRLGDEGQERPVVRVDDTHYIDVSSDIDDYDSAFFAGGGLERLREILEAQTRTPMPFVGAHGHTERIGAPIARPHQILCVGLNYSDHAAETGATVPPEPIIFNKAPNTLVGPYDGLRIPRGSTKTDWEVEMGIVVGKRASYLESAAEAHDAIAGYVLVNDVSERDFQLERSGQWVKGKSAETFNPAGPWLATGDELPGVTNLRMWLDVNGERKQTGSTSTMVFDPLFIVQYLSQFMVLEPGDLINTGTPPGVGMGQKPPQYLRPGDVVELGIEHLGSQRQVVLEPR